MSRLFLVAGLMLLVPAFTLAQSIVSPGESKKLPVSMYGESKPAKCTTCDRGPILQAQAEHYAGSGPYGRQLQAQLWWEYHECGPDGCPKPIGCGNFWTEKKFIFGSCRQFFGSASGTSGRHRGTVERP